MKFKFYILLFIILLSFYGYFFHWIGGWNESSRLDLVYSIVERHTFNIDPYHKNTGDKSFYKGHYYTDKAPGLSFFAAPVYILTKTFISISRLPISFDFPNSLTIFYLLTLICVGIPSALLGLLFYKFTGYFTDNRNFRLGTTLGYSLATMAFPYSTLFVGHQFSAVLGFTAFFTVFRARQTGRQDWKQLALAGFICGCAIISEYPMAMVAAGLFFYILSFLKFKKNIVFFILGALPPALLLMYYNYKCVGSPFMPTYKYLVFIPEFEGAKKGLFGIANFSFSSLYGITLGPYRGLYRTSPLLLLCIPGFYYFFKKKQYRPEFYLFLFVSLAFIFMNSSYYAWHGGATMGPRHIIPILPFMSAGLIFFLERFKENSLAKSIFKIFFMFSFLMMLFGTAVDPRLPPAGIEVNIFILMRLLAGVYAPNFTLFYHSVNLGTLFYSFFMPHLLIAPFVLTLLPLVVFFYVALLKPKKKFIGLLLVLFALFSYVYAAYIYMNIHGRSITSFLSIGEFMRGQEPLPEKIIPAGTYIWRGTVGDDGSDYYLLARDPFLRKGFHRYMDSPARRYQRLVYPLLSWVVSLGNINILPYAMVAINVTALIISVFLILRILSFGHKNMYMFIFYVFLPGFIFSLLKCIPDILSICFMIAAVHYFENKKNIMAAVFLSAASLTYELYAVIAAAFFVYYIYKKDKTNIFIFSIPMIILAVWQVVVFLIFKTPAFASALSREAGGGIGGGLDQAVPFYGMAKTAVSLPVLGDYRLIVLGACLLLAVIFAIAHSIAAFKKEISPITIALIGYSVFSCFFTFGNVLVEFGGPLRILNSLFITTFLSFAVNEKETKLPLALYFTMPIYFLYTSWILAPYIYAL